MAAVMAEDSNETSAVQQMLSRVAQSCAVIRSQQRGDPELTMEEKLEALNDILVKSHASFLARFGPFLAEEDLVCFDENDFEQKFHLKEIRHNFDPAHVRRVIRNRRAECMRRLLEEGDYFSDRSISLRNPLLFEQYVGQFMSEDERSAMDLDGQQRSECALSAMLMFQMQQDRRSRLLAKQKEQEYDDEVISGMQDLSLPKNEPQQQVSTTRSPSTQSASTRDGDDEDDDDAEAHASAAPWGEVTEPKPSEDKQTAQVTTGPESQELALLRHELLSIVQQLFLDGEDKEFDYSAVDSNTEYDNLDVRRQDEEEAYFETEDPEDCLADEEDLAWLRSLAAKRAAQPPPEFEEEFDEDDDEEEEMDAA
ncbi:coiled-coil domain-containing protein 97-like [Sycon ciliatum]|uniref:coiled-coil domain-containing protein 97-like n=1 Tax=Sycon ciliatum TaxID=27933 RepID=UPI0031F72131